MDLRKNGSQGDRLGIKSGLSGKDAEVKIGCIYSIASKISSFNFYSKYIFESSNKSTGELIGTKPVQPGENSDQEKATNISQNFNLLRKKVYDFVGERSRF